ncbi:MAG: hypothetical protein ABIN80_13645 [Dyadobacter sp.]|uniref:hypothetical protein n=1 Tax=Dyadobacter sp. TaxID=1914288 RepID=UPI003263C009
MNPIDFEKTQLFADRAKDMHASAGDTPPAPAQAAIPIPTLVKPTIKILSKEEKIALAAGGVLAMGLGTIVIVGLNGTEAGAPDVDQNIEIEKPILETPKIETNGGAVDTEPAGKDKPEIISHKTSHQTTHTSSGNTGGNSHALFTMPDELEVATNVTDDMPFESAFNSARSEVGPGGLFVWNNTYYGTFRESEWSDLSDEQKEIWLEATEPILDPVIPEPDPVIDNHVVVAERGEITWTGIDKDEDGIAEVLIAHAKGNAPIVMMDTDGDKLLDTRYSMDENGQVVTAALEKTSFTLADVHQIPEMESGSVFGNVVGAYAQDSHDLPVTIIQENGSYVVGIDLDKDSLVDVISLKRENESPFVALDLDNDGQVETSFVYNADAQSLQSMKLEPMQPMTVYEQEDSSANLYSSGDEETPDFDADRDPEDELADETTSDQLETGDLNAYSDTNEDHYFNNNAEAAEDFIG